LYLKFEEKFLAFCDPKADTKNLVLEGEISTPTFYDPNKIKGLFFLALALYQLTNHLFFLMWLQHGFI